MTRVPELRFAGFAGDWEESVLDKNLISLKSGLSRKLSDYDIGIPVVRANNTYDNRLDLKNNIKYWYDVDPKGADTNSYIIEKNDILINFINSMSKMGTAALVIENPERKTIYTTNIMRLRTNKSLNPFFYLMLTLTVNYRKYIESISMQAVNQSSFTTKDYRMYKFYKPSYKEQEKIGDLFSKIDQLIESQQELVDETMALKKSMLQKMFPKKDSLVPEFRFYGFKGNWENKKINEISEIVGGGTPKTSESSYWNGSINWFSPTEINKSIYYSNSANKITKLGLEKSSAKLLPYKNTILFTSRATIGNVGLIEEDSATNQGFQNFVIRDGINKYFLFTYLQFIKNEFLKLATGSTFKEISKKSIEDIIISIPKLEEQEKIGNFFRKLDEKIASEEKLLDAYKDMKKSLLQKMFV